MIKNNFSIYLKIKSNHKSNIHNFLLEIKKFSYHLNLPYIGPISLPYYSKLYTVLRSPHVHKKARDQFEYKLVQKLIIINFDVTDIYKLKLFLNSIYLLSATVQIRVKFRKNYAQKDLNPQLIDP